ncbi:elongin-B-like [Peromyscus californicus insignis]|uniref:elongin-B-like n=1 Tax=Peromyscus californicus insignis TaxID=564181 RepID=UPI0022A6EA10|nr:elongin-B-like [Peromyscus californicus insignis]
MDVFLTTQRHKTTVSIDAKELSIGVIIQGILKQPPDEQRLFKNDQFLDDGITLGQTAQPPAPATVCLVFPAGNAFQALHIEPFSSPPELPEVKKPQDSGDSVNE